MLFDERLPYLVSKTEQNPTLDRAKLHVFAFFFALLLGAGPVLAGDQEPARRLDPRRQPGQTQRVRVVLEVRGELKLNADGEGVRRMPLEVQGELLYDERLLAVDTESDRRRDARRYATAEARFQLGDTAHRVTLEDERRTIMVAVEGAQTTLFSPLGPLTTEQLELIDVQGNSTVLDRLLPTAAVQVGESWSHEPSTMAALLRLEAVSEARIKSTLRAWRGRVAVIDMTGDVSGSVGGVSTDITLNAVYHFDLDKRMITWFTMAIREERAIGHAQPGLEVTARLRCVADVAEPPAELADAILSDLPLDPEPAVTMLRFDSDPGRFSFLMPRGWQPMVDRHDVSILRLVERGDLIAQCNVSRLAALKPGKRPVLEGFQADIRRALGARFGSVLDTSTWTNDNGLDVLRVIVSGVVDEIPIQWNYYLFSDASGQQVSVVFTLDARLVERFAASDQPLVQSLRFEAEQGAEETAAAPDNDRAAQRPARRIE